MEKQFYCIDEQTKISGILIELNCKKMVHNYEKTEQQLDAILEGSKGRIILTMGGKILINTMDEKKLAETIIENVRHYFGDSINKPKNTADEALIIKRADDWLSGKKRKRDTDKTPQQYADFVVERAKRDFATNTDRAERGDTITAFKEIIDAVEQWAEMKRKQPKTKKAKEPEPRKAINKHGHFCSTITESQAQILFQLLIEKQYINGEVSDWMICCGAKEGTIGKRINWLQGLNELAYFVRMLFWSTNDNKWAIAVNVFSWKGNDINKNSIRSLDNQCKIAKAKQNALDEILRKVLKNNSIVNELRNK